MHRKQNVRSGDFEQISPLLIFRGKGGKHGGRLGANGFALLAVRKGQGANLFLTLKIKKENIYLYKNKKKYIEGWKTKNALAKPNLKM